LGFFSTPSTILKKKEKDMRKNVGGIDKNIRLLLGSILVLICLFAPIGTGWRIGTGVVGVIAFLTGFSGL
jgi:hypothetical protein